MGDFKDSLEMTKLPDRTKKSIARFFLAVIIIGAVLGAILDFTNILDFLGLTANSGTKEKKPDASTYTVQDIDENSGITQAVGTNSGINAPVNVNNGTIQNIQGQNVTVNNNQTYVQQIYQPATLPKPKTSRPKTQDFIVKGIRPGEKVRITYGIAVKHEQTGIADQEGKVVFHNVPVNSIIRVWWGNKSQNTRSDYGNFNCMEYP